MSKSSSLFAGDTFRNTLAIVTGQDGTLQVGGGGGVSGLSKFNLWLRFHRAPSCDKEGKVKTIHKSNIDKSYEMENKSSYFVHSFCV